MSWYKEYKNQWKEIIETIASEEHRTTQMIEKDIIQSMILLGLSKSKISFVFKGGTSLSKCYGLIERFSEDIDLSLNYKPTESEKREIKTIIIETAKNIGLNLTNSDDVKSRYNYNKYVFEYESLFNEIPLELIVETSFYQTVYPVKIHTVDSFVGKFCINRNVELPIPFEASSVNILVQSLERTFIDKVFAVCDYKIQNMQDRDSRHLYDIAKIMPEIKINEDLKGLIREVRMDRMKSKNNPSAQPKYNISKMLEEIIESRFYETDYNNITKRLLYEDFSYEKAIEKGISKVVEMDIF